MVEYKNVTILYDSAPKGAHDILRATDNKGVPFLDVLIDCEQKNVIADGTVQKYLSDVWVSKRSISFSYFKVVLTLTQMQRYCFAITIPSKLCVTPYK